MRRFIASIAFLAALVVGAPAFAQSTDSPVATAPIEVAELNVSEVTDTMSVTPQDSSTPAGHSDEVALPPPETDNQVRLDMLATGKTGWLFKDQSFQATTDPFASVSLDLSKEWFRAGAWYGQSADQKELDLTTGAVKKVGGVEYSGKLGLFLLNGSKPVYDLQVAASVPLGDHCGIALSGEMMRMGFDDDVLKLEGECTFPLTDKASVGGSLGGAHSRWAGRTSIPFSAGFNYTFDNGLTLGIGMEGYYAPTAPGQPDFVAVGLIGVSHALSY